MAKKILTAVERILIIVSVIYINILAIVPFAYDGSIPIYAAALFPTFLAWGIGAVSIASIFGLILILFFPRYARLIGYALIISINVLALLIFINVIGSYTLSIGAMFGVLSFVFVLLALIIDFILYLLGGIEDEVNIDKRITAVRELKALQEEGIITAEEYEAKRQEILKIKPTKAAAKVSDKK